MKNELKLIISDSKYKEGDKLVINETLLLEKLMDYIFSLKVGSPRELYNQSNLNFSSYDGEGENWTEIKG